MNGNTSKWNEKIVYFWFSDKQIFEYSEDDFRRDVKALCENGATMVTNFSLTHFRMGFYRYWDAINESMKKFVKVCHEFGIKVLEHHSASLVHNLTTSAGWKRFEDDLGSYSDWTATVDGWIEVPRFLINNPTIEGLPLMEMFQVDGRTGELANTVYDTYAFCFNNPNYRRIYFNYLKDMFEKIPFDGIYNDDVQYFADGNACTCKHCRKLFREQYGYELPEPHEWAEFYGDYANPVFVAWERFKRESTERLYRDMGDFYKSCGLELIRPNYISACMYHNKTSCGFDRAFDMWDFVSQENCFSAIIKQSYPDFMVEAVHRYAVAEDSKYPSISEFYPDRPDNVYFSWALARTWCQTYSGMFEGRDITGLEKKYRDFEEEHFEFLSDAKKREDIAFYFSMQTRDFLKDADKRFMEPAGGVIQAAQMAGYSANLAFEKNTVDELIRHKCIVCANVAMVSDDELSRFNEYVRRGGRLVIMGNFAEHNADGSARDLNDAAKALGMNVHIKREENHGDITLGNIRIDGMDALCSFTGGEAIAEMDGKTVGVRDGNIIWYAARPELSELQETVWANRRDVPPPRVRANPSLRAYQLSHSGAFLKAILGAPRAQVDCEGELLWSAHDTPGGIALHIVNIENTIPEDDREVGHEDAIENFTDGAKKLPKIDVSVTTDDVFTSATLYTPEDGCEHKLKMSAKAGELCIEIPEGTFAGYALIKLQK